MRHVTLDIETQRMVEDWDRPWEAGIACVGVDASWHPAPMVFDEHNLHKLPALVASADTIVSYNGIRFDMPVVEHYCGALEIKEHVDLMVILYKRLGWRPKLEHVARATLAVGKGGHGAMAPDMYQRGHFAQLHSYCLRDVALTRRLYEFAIGCGYLLVWDTKGGRPIVVELDEVGRRPAKGWTPGFWHKAHGVGR